MSFVSALCRRALRSRPLVLGAAVAAGLATVAALDERPPRPAGPLHDVTWVAAARAAEPPKTAPTDAKAGAAPSPPMPADAPAPADKARPKVDAEISIGESGVIIRRNRDDTDARAGVGDPDFESFEAFVEQAPWLAGLVFMVTALAFLVPLLIIALVVWYKMRRTRMNNETMLKLAERGVVPPAQAIEALGSGRQEALLQSVPPTAPLYEQAKQVRRRAAWSDLRKGVILSGVGLGLALWGVLDDGTPNGLGFVLLFVGIGYVVLWYFEDRQAGTPRETPGGTPGGA